MGMFMLWNIPPRTIMPWFLYINSVTQAATIYVLWWYYDSGMLGKPVELDSDKHV